MDLVLTVLITLNLKFEVMQLNQLALADRVDTQVVINRKHQILLDLFKQIDESAVLFHSDYYLVLVIELQNVEFPLQLLKSKHMFANIIRHISLL